MKISPDFYAEWRERLVPALALREPGAAAPPEKLLQALWYHQRLLRDRLHTADGRKLVVLHPGFWNHEAGPDFRGAVVQFDDEPPCSGDVEIDVVAGGWRAHSHDRNPAFQNVVLHVVWENPPKAGEPVRPTLALQPHLDAPLLEIRGWLGSASPEMPVVLTGQCSAPLRGLDEPVLLEVLHQAARVRLQSKAALLETRARQAGWEQALWEGLFAALGYKQNVWPLRRLAELLPRLTARQHQRPASLLDWQSWLFGVAGLLPAEAARRQAGAETYLRGLWDAWWRERGEWTDRILPRAAWHFHGLRPANQPQRRLALAAHWLAAGNLPARLEQWLKAETPAAKAAVSLLEILQAPRDPFWSWHATFHSARAGRPRPLLGAARVTDLAVNVILPWFWQRARAGKNAALAREVEARYFAWPAAQDNAVLRLARQRLLGGRPARALRTAAAQQGLMQIVHDFCEHSNAVCEHCRFPELVRALHKSA